jgi:hypothetical protein
MLKLPRLPAHASVLEGKYTAAQMRAYARKVEAETKEACAKICDEMANRLTSQACAKRIRGEVEP